MKIYQMLIALLFCSTASAGVISGGGGKGVLCADSDGQKSVQLLDFYEARAVYGLTLENQNADFETALKFALQRFDALWRNPNSSPQPSVVIEGAAKGIKKSFFESVRYIGANEKLTPTDDAFAPVLPQNCSLVQVATYYVEDVVLIDPSLYQLMTPFDQMGLVLHEMIYKDHRLQGALNSEATRKFLGRLLSTKPWANRLAELPQSDYLECYAGIEGQTPVHHFYAFKYRSDDKEKVVLIFEQLNDAAPWVRTYAETENGFFWNQLTDESVSFGRSLSLRSDFNKEISKVLISRKLPQESEIQIVEAGKLPKPSSRFFCNKH